MSDGASYFRPPHAVVCWCDETSVYVELPMEPVPYIQKYPITEAGFHKALSALKDIHERIGKSYVLYTREDIKQAYRKKPEKVKPSFNEAQLRIATQILKAKGRL